MTMEVKVRESRIDLTSWVIIEKSVLSNEPRRRGPRELRSMEGSMGPRAFTVKSQRIWPTLTGGRKGTSGVLRRADDGNF